MKTVARIASLLLALVMVFGLSVTAFAAETGTITVDNPIAGQTYTAYKIFDVTYDEAKSTYAYSIAGNSEWYDVVKDYTGITLTKAASENTYAVTKKDTSSAAASSREVMLFELTVGPIVPSQRIHFAPLVLAGRKICRIIPGSDIVLFPTILALGEPKRSLTPCARRPTVTATIGIGTS